jgi:hypothetical protein
VRTILFIAAALLLAGCDTGEGWVPGDDGKYAQEPAERPSSAPPAPLVYAPPAPALAQAPVVQAPPTPIPAQTPAIEAASATPPAIPLVNTHCQAVAHQRAADARANGYSFEMEDLIYDGTYKDCVQWDSRHGR